MVRPINQAPYYDDYDPDDGYVMLLAKAGAAFQSREWNSMQSMLLDYIVRVSSAVLSDGAVVSGCTLTTTGSTVEISSGMIFLAGLVRRSLPTSLTIRGSGDETIGVKLEESIITYEQDDSLLEPAVNSPYYGRSGQDRKQEKVVWTVNDPNSVTVYRLRDGVVVTEAKTSDSELSYIDTLARRTYDESGNYTVSGLELLNSVRSDEYNRYVTLTQGKAYIKGYEVVKSFLTEVPFRQPNQTKLVQNEPKVISSGQLKYSLNNYPASSINKLVASVKKTVTMTRGNVSNGSDLLPDNPVVRIVSVKAGSTTYVQNTSYRLNNNAVDWSLSGDEPGIGTSYVVEYIYNKELVEGTDFELTEEGGRSVLTLDPSNDYDIGSTFYVDYEFTLSRIDLVLLDQYGIVTVLEGVPDTAYSVVSPINQDDSKLVIGNALVTPGNIPMIIGNYDTRRRTMYEITNLEKRIADSEYNQAIDDLDKQAMVGEPATNLRGILTDGFIGFTKGDLTHNLYKCSIDPQKQYLSMPFETQVEPLQYDPLGVDVRVHQFDNVLTAPFTEGVALNQPNATDTILVNPYASYNPAAMVTIDPTMDTWVDTEVINIDVGDQVILVPAGAVSANAMDAYLSQNYSGYTFMDKSDSVSTSTTTSGRSITTTTTTTSTYELARAASEVVLNSAIQYMRPTEIVVEGHNFEVYEDNIKVYFNNRLVVADPFDQSNSGTEAGTLKANSEGYFKGSFVVPSNTPCGSVEVRVEGRRTQGRTVYTAEGRKQVTQKTSESRVLVTFTNESISTRSRDPIAQSFSFDTDTIITGTGIYFAVKDESKSVMIQVREVVNGYPGSTVLAEAILRPAEIYTSETGTVESRVTFSQPVYCEAGTEYAICVLTESNKCRMFYAKTGETDLVSRELISRQAYARGVMFSSSNGMAWTTHQDSDIKFKIYQANFTGNGSIVFDPIYTREWVRFMMTGQFMDNKNSGMRFFYRTHESGEWEPLTLYREMFLRNASTFIQIKLEFDVVDNISPILAKDSFLLANFVDGLTGSYITRTVTLDSPASTLRLILGETYLPAGTSIKVYYSLNGTSWQQITSTPTVTPISSTTNRYEYSATGLDAPVLKFRIDLALSSRIYRPWVKDFMAIMKV